MLHLIGFLYKLSVFVKPQSLSFIISSELMILTNYWHVVSISVMCFFVCFISETTEDFVDFWNSMPVLKCLVNLNFARVYPVYRLGCLCLE
jgi:hypothetical protein